MERWKARYAGVLTDPGGHIVGLKVGATLAI